MRRMGRVSFLWASYGLDGAFLSGLGGAGGSVGDCCISNPSTRLHSLVAISVLMLRNLMHSASVSSHS
jgi:hypothetical protein